MKTIYVWRDGKLVDKATVTLRDDVVSFVEWLPPPFLVLKPWQREMLESVALTANRLPGKS